MQFATWWYIVLAVSAPICLILYRHAARQRQRTLRSLLGTMPLPRLVGSAPGPEWRRALLVAGAMLGLVLALMQPQWGKGAQDGRRAGRDIVVLLDTSLSMLAEDVRPNRLSAAKLAIGRLVDQIKRRGGDRLALVSFAGRASLKCPLTLDYDLFFTRLTELRPADGAGAGTLIGDAIRHSLERLPGLESGFTDVILVTDGEDHGSAPRDAARALADAGIDLYPVGIGDPQAGAPIPVTGADGVRRSIRDHGIEVRSRLDQKLLADMASVTPHGHATADWDSDVLQRLYLDEIVAKPQRSIAHQGTNLPVHRFQWFVLASFLLLAIEMLWVDRSVRPA